MKFGGRKVEGSGFVLRFYDFGFLNFGKEIVGN